MALLNVSEIKKSFGENTLFEGVSFLIEEKDKIGLVGVNGAGKTTLLKILLNEMSYDGGEIFASKFLKTSYLEQHTSLESNNTVYEEILNVFSDLEEIEKEIEKLTAEITNNPENAEELSHRLSDLNDEFERRGGFTYKNKARSSLLGLGFTEDELSMHVNNLSGGQKTRVMLCKILMGSSNLLFLDEPTNHLDINSVEWLENFLINEYNGAFVVISHDRYFLDKVTNKTFEMENEKLTVYKGNYTTYLNLKEERKKAELNHFSNTRKEIKRLEGIIKQQKQWNREKNIKTAESKQKIIDRLEKDLNAPQKEPGAVHFKFNTKNNSGNDILIIEALKMGFGDNLLFENGNMFIKKKENVFLLGSNGCGKTTLLKLILDKLKPLNGTIKIGSNIDLGYYDQIQSELNLNKEAFDEIHDAYPNMTETEIRNAMAAFLFKGDDVFKKIEVLSGGERARIELIKLMLSGSNFLLLDEPTNHLDIASREALEDALSDYEGTILAVSHDRYFINKLAGKIYEMKKNGFDKYEGNYDFYLEKRRLSEEASKPKAVSTNKEDYKLKKQIEAQKRKIKNRLSAVEEEINILEAEIEGLNNEILKPEIATDYVKAGELTALVEEKNNELTKLYSEWEELSLSAEEN